MPKYYLADPRRRHADRPGDEKRADAGGVEEQVGGTTDEPHGAVEPARQDAEELRRVAEEARDVHERERADALNDTLEQMKAVEEIRRASRNLTDKRELNSN